MSIGRTRENSMSASVQSFLHWYRTINVYSSKQNKLQTLVFYLLISSSCLVNRLFLVWEVCLLQSFILSQGVNSNLAWRQPILYTLEKDRGSFFLLGSCWSLCMVTHVQSMCHAGVNIGGKADVPPSVFFSLLWNYFVQVAFI